METVIILRFVTIKAAPILLAILTFAVVMLMMNSASARIGWTLQDCEDHFGTPINTDWSEGISAGRTFKHGAMTVEVAFESGKVTEITYALHRPFYVEEITDLMEKNIEGRNVEWIQSPWQSPITDGAGKPLGHDLTYRTTQDSDGFVIICALSFYPNRPPRAVTFYLDKGMINGL